MRIIRWGMIGCGSVTEVKSGPAFNKVPNSILMAVTRDAELEGIDLNEHAESAYEMASSSRGGASA